MAEDSPAGPVEVFAAELRDLHVTCGSPSTTDLKKVARILPPMQDRNRSFKWADLAPATVSEMLNAKRKKPPKVPLLITFVLSCEWYTWNTGIPQQYGTSEARTALPDHDQVLRHWLTRRAEVETSLRAEKEKAKTARLPSPAATRGPATGETATPAVLRSLAAVPPPGKDTPPEPVQVAGMPDQSSWVVSDRGWAGSWRLPDQSSWGDSPVALPPSDTNPDRLPTVNELLEKIDCDRVQRHLLLEETGEENLFGPPPVPPRRAPRSPFYWSRSQMRMREAFGETGRELYDLAEAGDLGACYRLGVLLCTADRLFEAEVYLDRAASGRNGDANALLKHPWKKRRFLAVEHARILGQEEAAEDHRHQAVMYLTAAAQDNDDAALLLATVLRRMGHDDKADAWLSRITGKGKVTTIMPTPTQGRHHSDSEQGSIATQGIDMVMLMRIQDLGVVPPMRPTA